MYAFRGCMKREHSIGASVSDTSADTAIDAVTVRANSRNSRPMMPPISSSGMNTAISDTLIDSTVKPISREPLSAASNGGSPSSMWRWMFSTTTMASSTTKPTAMVSAISDRLSRLKPQQVHRRERAEQRQRHRHARNERRPEIAQEQQDHHHHQARW